MKKHRGILIVMIIIFSSLCFGNKLFSTNIQEPEPLTAENESLKTKDTVFGAWIIIAGDRWDHDKQKSIKNGCNITYEILSELGFTSDQICYLGPEVGSSQPYVLVESTLINIQWAIETWAALRVDASNALGIYMFDHGGTDKLCIPNGDYLYPDDLDGYLDNLQSSTGCKRVVLVYEACKSGSFIDELSQDNRIIVTSTDADYPAYVNDDFSWALFSESFWASILACNTIGEAFEDAASTVRACEYYSRQSPLIDDNHDSVGNRIDSDGNLPNGGDGDDALDTLIKAGVISNCIEIAVGMWPSNFWHDHHVDAIPIWAKIQNTSTIKTVYARIIPPNWTPPPPEPPDQNGSKMTEPFNMTHPIEILPLTDLIGDGNYSANFIKPGSWNSGRFKINFIAKTVDGGFANVKSTYFTLNDDGIPPPDTTDPTISITDPRPDETVSGTIEIIAEGEDDHALQTIQIFLDGEQLTEKTMPPHQPYMANYTLDTTQYADGNHNITAKAIDKDGHFNTTSIIVNFQNQAIPSFGFTTVIIGCLLVVMTIYNLKKREKLFIS